MHSFFWIAIRRWREEERTHNYGVKLTPDGYEVQYARSLGIGYAKKFVETIMQLLEELQQQSHPSDGSHPRPLQIIRTKNELSTCLKQEDTIGAILHFEGAEAIDSNLKQMEKDLAAYYQKGLRSLGLVWSRANSFGHGVPFKFPASPDIGPGLTHAGQGLVTECNEIGIIVDLAHLNLKGFMDVAKISKHPLVVSHSNVHAICRSSRNLLDKQIDLVADSNGVIGINFCPSMIRPDGRPEAPETPISMIIDHIDYIVKRIGIDHVALGSDFDGATMPDALKDAAALPALVYKLKKQYELDGLDALSEEFLDKLLYKNWQRVINDTWK
ncbi:MAG: dipeptidase [Oligoflexia bacterium]|nr:dipeptidase [Oligoflexia bacterium]